MAYTLFLAMPALRNWSTSSIGMLWPVTCVIAEIQTFYQNLKETRIFFGFMLEFTALVVQMNHCLPPKQTMAVISRMDYSLRTTLMPSCHDQNALPKLNRTTLIFDLPLQLPATSIQSDCNLHLHRVRPTSQILHLHKSLHVNLKQIDSIYQTLRTHQI